MVHVEAWRTYMTYGTVYDHLKVLAEIVEKTDPDREV